MFKKISLFLVICSCLFGFMKMNGHLDENDDKAIGFNFRVDDAMCSGEPRIRYDGPPVIYTPDEPVVVKDDFFIVTINEVDPAGRTFYDLQSNGCPQQIWQDAARPSNLHAVFMVDPVGGVGFPDRRSRYFFSGDMGNTWGFLGNVPAVRSGFPGISVFSDGTGAIVNHSTDGSGLLRTQAYKDSFIGAGSFTGCDPGNSNPGPDQPIWPHFVTTMNTSLTSKLVFVASKQIDSAFINRWTGFAPSCSFSGYVPYPRIDIANSYDVARGTDGRIGVAYISSDSYPSGSVFFMQSTDNGFTFSVPLQIWFPNYATGDSLGALRSVDITYQNISPKVAFSVCKQDGQGSYFPNRPSKTYMWSPGINGGNPVLIDSAGGLTGSTESDVFFSSCRPAIGTSYNGNYVFAAWCRARTETSSQGIHFFDIYFAYSQNGGLTWPFRTRITNNSGPLRDCRYVSMSPVNREIVNSYYAHLIYQSDSIPGSFVLGSQMSLARMMYVKIEFSFTGIKNINTDIPDIFRLQQNYPNPFNPSTKIRFDIPSNVKRQTSNVKVVIYDVLGRETAILVNEQLKPGTYEVDWDASTYPSGVYYYKLTSNDYTETKKMVLLK